MYQVNWPKSHFLYIFRFRSLCSGLHFIVKQFLFDFWQFRFHRHVVSSSLTAQLMKKENCFKIIKNINTSNSTLINLFVEKEELFATFWYPQISNEKFMVYLDVIHTFSHTVSLRIQKAKHKGAFTFKRLI